MQDLKEFFITSSKEYEEGAVYLFEQNFNIDGIKSAKLYMTALGMYEAELNDKKIGEQIFAPGFTYYHRNFNYQKYDITDMLHNGVNTLRVYLGQGWYCGRFTFNNKTQIYGSQSAVSWILLLEYADGTIKKITSDEKVNELESPYKYAGIYDGEEYFASTSKKVIGTAVKFQGNIPEVLDETDIIVKLQEEMPVKNVRKSNVMTILDFGQNFAGIVEIDPSKLKNGQTLTIRHGEVLNPDGTLYTANLRKAKATIIYHSGDETKKYRPRFTYMGFRYMELSGAEYSEGLITAHALYSDMKRTGYFTCENPLVQKLFENQIWGQKSNYIEVPTDCPQRDERMGYTGDGHVFALTGSYNYDTERFWNKFLKDIRYSQMDNSEGYIGSTIPADGPGGIGFLNMLGWGNAVTIIPEMLYWQYGDESYLLNQYDSIKKFVDAEIRKMGDKNLWIGTNLGDWLMMGKGMEWMAMHNNPVSNSFIVHDLEVLAETARRLSINEDEEKYKRQLELTRKAYLESFVEQNGEVSGDYQGAYIMALKFVITDRELREKVLKRLIENIRKDGMQTGFFATEHILPLLVEAGEVKLAYDILLQENCPGWMYQIKCGATTTWERWDALKPDGKINDEKVGKENMVSFNHYAFGSVGEFYYRYILGIQPLLPGYKKVKLKPYIDERLGSVSGSYLSRAGEIKVSWSVDDQEVKLAFTTPTEADIELPDGQKITVQKGDYTFNCRRIL